MGSQAWRGVGLLTLVMTVLLSWAVLEAAEESPFRATAGAGSNEGHAPLFLALVDKMVPPNGAVPGIGSETPQTRSVETMGSAASPGITSGEIELSCAVMLFGLVVIAVEAFLAVREKLSEGVVVKLIGLTIVVVGALFVIPAGYSSSQIAPLMGLLGVVAGYLCGKDSNGQKPTP